jgi:hypothetical protein
VNLAVEISLPETGDENPELKKGKNKYQSESTL